MDFKHIYLTFLSVILLLFCACATKPALNIENKTQKLPQEIKEITPQNVNTKQFALNNLLDMEEVARNEGLKIFINMPYFTTENFTGKKLYSNQKCYLNRDTAKQIVNVAKQLQEEDLYLYFFDCYRPLSVQKTMYTIVNTYGLVANPKTGSNHNRGTAVDLTLCDEKGQPLPMPSAFDEFGPSAYSTYIGGGNIPPSSIKNRNMLQKIMRENNFTTIKKEWWHFNLKDAKNYPVLDIPL